MGRRQQLLGASVTPSGSSVREAQVVGWSRKMPVVAAVTVPRPVGRSPVQVAVARRVVAMGVSSFRVVIRLRVSRRRVRVVARAGPMPSRGLAGWIGTMVPQVGRWVRWGPPECGAGSGRRSVGCRSRLVPTKVPQHSLTRDPCS